MSDFLKPLIYDDNRLETCRYDFLQTETIKIELKQDPSKFIFNVFDVFQKTTIHDRVCH